MTPSKPKKPRQSYSKLIDSLALSPAKQPQSSLGAKGIMTKTWDWQQASRQAFSNTTDRFFDQPSPSKQQHGKSPAKKRSHQATDNLEQTFIDAGQRAQGQVVCGKCKMLYFRGSLEDETTHKRYCKDAALAPKVVIKNWRSCKILNSFGDDGGIISVSLGEETAAIEQKLVALRKMVDTELGYTDNSGGNGNGDEVDDQKMLLYVEESGKVIGCLEAESTSVAWRIKRNEQQDDTTLQVDQQPVIGDIKCGVSRLWTSSESRRKGVATKLMDSLQRNMFYAVRLERNQIAVTTPSRDGRRFFES
eukprot:gene17289-20624_t